MNGSDMRPERADRPKNEQKYILIFRFVVKQRKIIWSMNSLRAERNAIILLFYFYE